MSTPPILSETGTSGKPGQTRRRSCGLHERSINVDRKLASEIHYESSLQPSVVLRPEYAAETSDDGEHGDKEAIIDTCDRGGSTIALTGSSTSAASSPKMLPPLAS